MPARPWSRLLLAILLVWQLNSAEALMHAPPAAPATHCAHHSGGPAAPQAPGCCQHGPAPCDCAQPAALSTPTLAFGDAPALDPLPVRDAAPPVEERASDFFRPPI